MKVLVSNEVKSWMKWRLMSTDNTAEEKNMMITLHEQKIYATKDKKKEEMINVKNS